MFGRRKARDPKDDLARRAVLAASAMEARELLMARDAPPDARMEAERRMQRFVDASTER